MLKVVGKRFVVVLLLILLAVSAGFGFIWWENSKYEDYTQYTVLKWALLASAGYEPAIFTSNDKILLYVMSTDTIYNLPNKVIEGKQYVCLNYHDYGYQVNFLKEKFKERFSNLKKNGVSFHYTIQKLPSFQRESYFEK